MKNRMQKIGILLAANVLVGSMLTGCGTDTAKESAKNQTVSEVVSEEEISAQSGSSEAVEAGSQAKSSRVAAASEMAEVQQISDEGLEPIKADALQEGTYPIEVECSSSMFRIVSCELTVKQNEMTAKMTMSGTGYTQVFMGTGEEAEQENAQTNYIPFEENEAGEHTFTVPVEALNQVVSCTAFSKRKEKWYDRTLLFRADSLPDEAFLQSDAKTVELLQLADGTYTAEVSLEGGSGRASVTSPAIITVKDGQAVATVEWSSSNYDYMRVDGQKYEPIHTEGNSTFEIPIAAFDKKLAVSADTTAMSEPHEIDYTLQFDSASLQPQS